MHIPTVPNFRRGGPIYVGGTKSAYVNILIFHPAIDASEMWICIAFHNFIFNRIEVTNGKKKCKQSTKLKNILKTIACF